MNDDLTTTQKLKLLMEPHLGRIYVYGSLLLGILTLALLAGCLPAKEIPKEKTELPPGLADCKAYRANINSSSVLVIRCPNSSVTTVTGGKSSKTVSVIDG